MGVRTFYVSIVVGFPSIVGLSVGFIMLHREYNQATEMAFAKIKEHVEVTLNEEYKSKGIRWSMEQEKVETARARGHEDSFIYNHIGISILHNIGPAVAGVVAADVNITVPAQTAAAGGTQMVQPAPLRGSPMTGSVSHSTPL